MHKKSAHTAETDGQRGTAKEETYSTIDVSPATNNFKTKEDRRNFREKSGANMFGKGKLLLIFKSDSTKAEIGSRKL